MYASLKKTTDFAVCINIKKNTVPYLKSNLIKTPI